MVILPQTGLETARDVAEKLLSAIATHHFDQVGTVTASFGVTEFIPHDDSKLMAQRADDALYRAKSLGRNHAEV